MTGALHLERRAAEAAQGLPALLADAESLAATLMAGAHGRRRAGAGETFWQYRDYTRDDPASAIDWRQSARSPARHFVRETEWETAATVRLWCGGGNGFGYGSEGHPTKRWRAQVVTTALALLLTRAGERIGLLPPDAPGSGGQRAVITLAEHLTLSDEAGEHISLPPIPALGTTQAVYISDFYAETGPLLDQIGAIASAGLPAHIVQVSDPAEENFPFAGHHVFELPAKGKRRRGLRFGDAAAVAKEYAAARAAHLGAVEDQCRRFGLTFLRHRTDHPATPVLTALHRAISGHLS